MPDDPSPTASDRRRPWLRLWPLALLLAAIGLAYALGLHRVLSFEALAEHRATLAGFVAARPVPALLLYVLTYVVVVGFSLPGATVMTLAGGFLFGPWLGAAAAVAGATIGACLLFLAARHALADSLARRAGPRLGKLREALARDGFWYLLSLRLLPVLPFWFVNLAPALAGMPLAPYAAATFLGIIPASLVFAGIGAGLGQVFESGGRPDLTVIFSPGILLPLLGLAALSLLGAWWRRRQRAA
ncbi:TVP38/TMEM64 family protein [Roseicella aerolata]|uniref:TVP38/TMEM64 family membrane protein n=1 Tax=Roseicella aerolata TaxID=2883479 RepID=A0A9X1IC90_9PROT|nr:VTT domain-containing protein [Roseicella aerolata]MCB4820693.1 VTT domain-containing protein [Roseicella aerolata]